MAFFANFHQKREKKWEKNQKNFSKAPTVTQRITIFFRKSRFLTKLSEKDFPLYRFKFAAMDFCVRNLLYLQLTTLFLPKFPCLFLRSGVGALVKKLQSFITFVCGN